MGNRFLRFLQLGVFALDLLSLNVIIITLYYLLPRINENYIDEYFSFLLIMNISWGLICWVSRLYNDKNILSFEVFTKRTIQVFCYWIAFILFYLFFGHQYELSRLFTGIIIVSHGVMLLVNRFFYLMMRSYLRERHFMVRRVVIIGYNETSKKLASILEKDDMSIEIIGYCEDEENIRELSNYPIVSSINQFIKISQDYHVNEVYSTIAPEHNREIYQIMRDADRACIQFRYIPDLNFLIKKPVYIDYLMGMPVLSLRQEPLNNADNRIKKRLLDIFFSSLVIIFILSWLIPLLGLLIYLESKGPIFFVQKRTGRDKKVFNCLKFRSMKMNEHADLVQAKKNDNRLTKIGKFLRRSSIDELPQFINVFLGEMSVVGPRPHMVKHTDEYSKVLDQYMVRQFLKPGITGWAQVHGFRGEISNVEQLMGRVERDIWYLENWSFWLDVKIVFMTAFKIIKGDNNAF